MHVTRKTAPLLTLAAALAALGLAAPRPAQAQSASYNFTLGPFLNGGQLTGSFSGTPEGNGTLQYGTFPSYISNNVPGSVSGQKDLTTFTASLSGNSLVANNTLGLSNLNYFYYNPTGSFGPLLLFDASNTQFEFTSQSGQPEGTSYVYAFDGAGNVASEDATFHFAAITPLTAPAAVPEPSSVASFGLGGLGLLGLMVKARKRK